MFSRVAFPPDFIWSFHGVFALLSFILLCLYSLIVRLRIWNRGLDLLDPTTCPMGHQEAVRMHGQDTRQTQEFCHTGCRLRALSHPEENALHVQPDKLLTINVIGEGVPRAELFNTLVLTVRFAGFHLQTDVYHLSKYYFGVVKNKIMIIVMTPLVCSTSFYRVSVPQSKRKVIHPPGIEPWTSMRQTNALTVI